MAYTPSVYDAHEVLSWDAELNALPHPSSPQAPAVLNGNGVGKPGTGGGGEGNGNGNGIGDGIGGGEGEGKGAVRFSHLSCRIYEMCHALPAPLQPRSFAVLVASARTHTPSSQTPSPFPSPSGPAIAPSTASSSRLNAAPIEDTQDGFVVAQIPVDVSSVPAALYSTGRNVTEGISEVKRKRVVVGRYASVETGEEAEGG